MSGKCVNEVQILYAVCTTVRGKKGIRHPEKQQKSLSEVIQSFPYMTFKPNSAIKLCLAPVSHPASLSNGRLPVYLV